MNTKVENPMDQLMSIIKIDFDSSVFAFPILIDILHAWEWCGKPTNFNPETKGGEHQAYYQRMKKLERWGIPVHNRKNIRVVDLPLLKEKIGRKTVA